MRLDHLLSKIGLYVEHLSGVEIVDIVEQAHFGDHFMIHKSKDQV